MKRPNRSILIAFSAFFILNAGAQSTTLQVITKRIEKVFAYKDGYEVNIEGEKANVVIETWDKPEINVLIELTAKHSDKTIAEKDLEYMKFLAQRVKRNIYIRNYVSLPEGTTKPESTLSARYTIKLPEECPVYLKNYFGIARISNLSNRLRVNSQFTSIGLDNIQGFIDLRTRFGDLLGERLDGNVKIEARRSNITLRELKGRYDIKTQYGILEIFADHNLVDLNIEAEKSDVFLFNISPELFAYNIVAQHGNISMPNFMPFNFLENTVALKKANFKPKQEYFANITITISFGNLIVKEVKKP